MNQVALLHAEQAMAEAGLFEQEGKFSRCPAAFSNFGLSAKLQV